MESGRTGREVVVNSVEIDLISGLFGHGQDFPLAVKRNFSGARRRAEA